MTSSARSTRQRLSRSFKRSCMNSFRSVGIRASLLTAGPKQTSPTFNKLFRRCECRAVSLVFMPVTLTVITVLSAAYDITFGEAFVRCEQFGYLRIKDNKVFFSDGLVEAVLSQVRDDDSPAPPSAIQ
jgi:hypothetical protein